MKRTVGGNTKQNRTRATPQNNTKLGEGQADHEEAQAGVQAAAVEDSESREERTVHKDGWRRKRDFFLLAGLSVDTSKPSHDVRGDRGQ